MTVIHLDHAAKAAPASSASPIPNPGLPNCLGMVCEAPGARVGQTPDEAQTSFFSLR